MFKLIRLLCQIRTTRLLLQNCPIRTPKWSFMASPLSTTKNSKRSVQSVKVSWNVVGSAKFVDLGNFSQVYKCRYKDSPDELVAVKEIFDGDFREVKLISRCNHPNIVSYYGYFRQQGKICLVMEYLAGGDLHKYLINMKNVSHKIVLVWCTFYF